MKSHTTNAIARFARGGSLTVLALLACPAHAQVAPDAAKAEQAAGASAPAAPTSDPTAIGSDTAPADAPQNGIEGTENTLGDIVVTAQRRNESLQQTPIAVSAFTSDTLASRQILSVADVATNVPNVQMTSTLANQSSVTAFIRGAGQADSGFSFTEAAVGIYVDDVFHARLSGTNLEFNDIDRVEVLRGPQGTLYGRNNLTGAIKIVRKQPDGSTFGKAEASIGSRGYNTQKATFSTALVPDEIAVLVSGFRVKTGDYYRALSFGGKRGEREQYGGRVGVAFIGSEVFDAKFNVTYTHDEGDGAAPIAVADAAPFAPKGGLFDAYISPLANFGFNEQWAFDAQLSGKISDYVTLKSITAYITADDRFRFDTFGGQVSASGAYTVGFDRTSYSRNKQISQELQLVGDTPGGRLSYLFGLYYFHEDIKQLFDDTLLGFKILPDNIHQTIDSYAAFGQATYKLTETVSATVGARYTKEQKAIFGSMSNGVFLFPQTLTLVSNDNDYSAFTPKVEVDWQATPNIFTYASFSRGFQSGGFNASALANPTLFRTPYGEQTVSAYELGVKSDLMGKRLRINADYYYNRFGGLQTNVRTGNSVATQNAGTAEAHGPEVEITALPFEGFTLYGSGAVTFDRYLDLNPSSEAAINNARDLPRQSKYQAQVGFNFARSLSELAGAGDAAGSVKLGGDYTYRSSYFTSAGNLPISAIGGQNLFNASIGWTSADKRIDVTVAARNLLNERFYVSGGTYGVNRSAKLVNEPRLIRATLGLNF